MSVPTADEPPKTIGLSFRFKLMLIMVGVVGLVSITALFVTTRSLNNLYGDYLKEQTRRQADFFRQQQNLELQTAKDAMLDSSKNVRIFASLDIGDPERIYVDLNAELRRFKDREKHELSEIKERVFLPFFRYVDDQGDIVPPVDMQIAGQVRGLDESVIVQKLTTIAKTPMDEENINVISIGYTSFQAYGRSAIYKIISAPIYDEVDEWIWGKIIFATPMLFDAISPPKDAGLQIRNAFMTEGILYSDTMTPEQQKLVLENADAFDTTNEPLKFTLEGIDHQLFRKRVNTAHGFSEAFLFVLVPMTEQQNLNDTIRRMILSIIPFALLFAVVLSTVISHRMTRPIVNLVQGFESVGQGDLETAVPVIGNDEMSNASRRFNAMVSELKQKELIRDILDKTTDKRVAEDFLKGNHTLGGETCELSVLFCDIRGFTPLTDGMDPQEVVQLVNEHMTALTNVVHQHHGIVDKFVGDEIMVLFGALSSEKRNDAHDAVQCGLAMIAERQRLNETTERAIHIGIGVATGPVVAGRMGSENRLNYTVLGDRVNLASRLCSQAKAMELLFDEKTQQALPPEVKTEQLASISLKGFAEPVPVYRAET